MDSRRPVGVFSVESLVARHIGQVDQSLVTVMHQPQGLTAHTVTPDHEFQMDGVHTDHGTVIARGRHSRFGTMVFVMDGGAVTEIVLHDGEDQAVAYREYAEQRALSISRLDELLARMDESELLDEPEDGDRG